MRIQKITCPDKIIVIGIVTYLIRDILQITYLRYNMMIHTELNFKILSQVVFTVL